jgi:Yip1 domain
VSSESGAAVPSHRPDGFLTRIYGVLRRPRATFTAVLAAPAWVGLLAGLTVITAASRIALFETEIGRTALVDEWERTAIAFGQQVDDVRYEELKAWSAHSFAYGLSTALLSGPVLVLVVAGLVFMVFGRTHEDRVSFGQVCAVATVASVPLALRQIVGAATSYASESTANTMSIGTWFAGLDEASPLARFVGALDLFVIWWVVVLAIGVGVLYRRNARRLALAFLGAYAGLALLLAVTMVVLGPST